MPNKNQADELWRSIQGSKTRPFRLRLGRVGTGTADSVSRPVHELTYCIVLLDSGLGAESPRVGPKSRPIRPQVEADSAESAPSQGRVGSKFHII